MCQKISIFALVFTCFLSTHYVNAQKFLGFRNLTDTITEEKNGIFFLPLVYYTPDTRWAAGGAGVYYFKINPKHPHQQETRISYIRFLADYTQNKQLDTWAVWNIFSRNEDYLFKGELRFRNFPDRFYGIGNKTQQSDEEFYEYNLLSLKHLMLKKIKPSLFLGFDYVLSNEYGFKLEQGGQLIQETITGSRGGIGSGVGFVGVFDDRDNVINAYKGRLIEFSSYYYSNYLGSNFNFTNINFGYNYYYQIKKKHIIATQSILRFNFGNVPFLDLAKLGSDEIIRGYPANRFRDNNMWATQVEYRFPVWWRFGMTTFAGIGDVFNATSDLSLSSLKYSLGLGLRFVVNPAERLNVRLDYAVGREGGYFYLSVAEAF
jgi:hypothetical protein